MTIPDHFRTAVVKEFDSIDKYGSRNLDKGARAGLGAELGAIRDALSDTRVWLSPDRLPSHVRDPAYPTLASLLALCSTGHLTLL